MSTSRPRTGPPALLTSGCSHTHGETLPCSPALLPYRPPGVPPSRPLMSCRPGGALRFRLHCSLQAQTRRMFIHASEVADNDVPIKDVSRQGAGVLVAKQAAFACQGLLHVFVLLEAAWSPLSTTFFLRQVVPAATLSSGTPPAPATAASLPCLRRLNFFLSLRLYPCPCSCFSFAAEHPGDGPAAGELRARPCPPPAAQLGGGDRQRTHAGGHGAGVCHHAPVEACRSEGRQAGQRWAVVMAGRLRRWRRRWAGSGVAWFVGCGGALGGRGGGYCCKGRPCESPCSCVSFSQGAWQVGAAA